MDGEESSQNCPSFKWNGRRERAAVLLAEDELTDEEIAASVDITRRQLTTWKQHPEFAQRVQDLARRLGETARRYAVSRKSRRLAGYDARREKMLAVIEQRAADPVMQAVAGGDTGLLVRTVKSIGSGPAAHEVEEFEVDTGLLKELRELEKQAAIDAGQWMEKREHNIADIDALIAGELARVAALGKINSPATAEGDRKTRGPAGD